VGRSGGDGNARPPQGVGAAQEESHRSNDPINRGESPVTIHPGSRTTGVWTDHEGSPRAECFDMDLDSRVMPNAVLYRWGQQERRVGGEGDHAEEIVG
jgi:hypothetical protein